MKKAPGRNRPGARWLPPGPGSGSLGLDRLLLQDPRRDEDQQLPVSRRVRVLPEQVPEDGYLREPWQPGLVLIARDLQDPADDRRLAVADQDLGRRLLLVDRRRSCSRSH